MRAKLTPLYASVAEGAFGPLGGPDGIQVKKRGLKVLSRIGHGGGPLMDRQPMTNTSVRDRFGIPPQSAAKASRLIKEALDQGVIYPYDPSVGAKARRYVPFWARSDKDDHA